MNSNSFFNEMEDQSVVKATLVSKYFKVWANIIIGQVKGRGNKFAYIDLFAGKGRYDDESKSTPLLILEQAIENPDMQQMLVTIFNDKDEDNVRSLEQAIYSLPGINSLKYKPQVANQEIGANIVKMFEQMKMVPTLFFVDPWGYKGLSLQLINSVLKNWGSDCIFFFNYNRINMGLNNDMVHNHMNALFGANRADSLRSRLEPLSSYQRELVIVEEISQALKEMGGKYVLPFRFRNENNTRTMHYLIFVSKHSRGYGIMKDIMAKESTNEQQGVPTFEYVPSDSNQQLLFDLQRPLDQLENLLLTHFAGRTLSMLEIFDEHNIDTPYIKRNYKDALLNLEVTGRILTEPSKRRKDTFGDDVLVTFP